MDRAASSRAIRNAGPKHAAVQAQVVPCVRRARLSAFDLRTGRRGNAIRHWPRAQCGASICLGEIMCRENICVLRAHFEAYGSAWGFFDSDLPLTEFLSR
jgi:hypothetical protein